jgi:DNA-binding response OmpR family regulator
MGARILVIGDDPVIGAVVTAILGREGYEVVLAEDGPEGIAEAGAVDGALVKPFEPGDLLATDTRCSLSGP